MAECDHPMTSKLALAHTECIVCFRAQVEFEHARWRECAAAYAVERERRQKLEAAMTEEQLTGSEREACAQVAERLERTFRRDELAYVPTRDEAQRIHERTREAIAFAIRTRST